MWDYIIANTFRVKLEYELWKCNVSKNIRHLLGHLAWNAFYKNSAVSGTGLPAYLGEFSWHALNQIKTPRSAWCESTAARSIWAQNPLLSMVLPIKMSRWIVSVEAQVLPCGEPICTSNLPFCNWCPLLLATVQAARWGPGAERFLSLMDPIVRSSSEAGFLAGLFEQPLRPLHQSDAFLRLGRWVCNRKRCVSPAFWGRITFASIICFSDEWILQVTGSVIHLILLLWILYSYAKLCPSRVWE